MKFIVWLLAGYFIYKWFFKSSALAQFGRRSGNPANRSAGGSSTNSANNSKEHSSGHSNGSPKSNSSTNPKAGSKKASPFDTEGEYVDFEELD